jgi:predicted Zn-dependent protease
MPRSRQKKPVSFLSGLLLALAVGWACIAPAFSAADHYLCDEPRQLQMLLSQRWFDYEFPVRVYIPPVPYEVKQPEIYIPLVKTAFSSWSRLAPFATFTYVDTAKKANIVIEWKSDFKNEGAWGMAHYPILYQSKNKILRHRSTIYLAVRAQIGSGMSVSEPVLFSYDELLSIAKHEVGHALGLNHSKTQGDVMCGGCWGYTGNMIRDITNHDIQTLKALYALPLNTKKSPCKSQ